MSKNKYLKIVKNYFSYIPREKLKDIGTGRKGIYALFKENHKEYKVVYIGKSGTSMRSRLKGHKKKDWTHFSAFELKNFTRKNIKELEGIFLEIFSKDNRSIFLNQKRGFGLLKKVRTEEKDLNRKS